mmetsp:Transcript_19225/g.55830  ORF Transcript_19225/g.55830 Transcript_19225/m.55830 type:complete len:1053 (+) Transcript_19225:106-3264(+)
MGPAAVARAAAVGGATLLALAASSTSSGPAASCSRGGACEVAKETALIQFRHITARNAKRSTSTFNRFCGIAVNRENGNEYDTKDLESAVNIVGVEGLWHYNWRMSTDVHVPGVLFVPMIKEPGHTLGVSVSELPTANENGVGTVVKGWNEPDDPGQAGHDYKLRSGPEAFAQKWTDDMNVAASKGYTEFIGPAMAHDVCWLDHFLKACETTAGCPEKVTYLAFHRYRNDCDSYKASPDNIGWRSDLGYILSYYRLMEKYNRRNTGFQIRGLVWDEIGCFENDYSTFAAEQDQLKYINEWYVKTLLAVKAGDEVISAAIRSTPWIMPVGPDAHAGEYALGKCKAIDGGANAGEEALQAIRSLVSVAWFSISPALNHLWIGGEGGDGLSSLGKAYFNACKGGFGASDVSVAPSETPSEAIIDEPVSSEPTLVTEAPSDVVTELDGKTVRLVSAETGRELYANELNWGAGFGGRTPTGDESGFWKFTRVATGAFRIVNAAHERTLYAAPGYTGAERVGAGTPSYVGWDGNWTVYPQGDSKIKLVNVVSDRTLYDDGTVGATANHAGMWIVQVSAVTTTPPATTSAAASTSEASSAPTPETLDGGVFWIHNAQSGRYLYADPAQNWFRGFGARDTPDSSCAWKFIRRSDGSFRILNNASDRTLYAATGYTADERIGAGTSSYVGSDGNWNVEQSGAGFTFMNARSARGLYDNKYVGANHEPSSAGIWNLVPPSDMTTTTTTTPTTTTTVATTSTTTTTMSVTTVLPSSGLTLDGAVVRIVNAATNARLFALATGNWHFDFGAAVNAADESASWKLTKQADGTYRIATVDAGRELYAAPGNVGTASVGAGNPVGTDGAWQIESLGGDHYRLTNVESTRRLKIDGTAVAADIGATGDEAAWLLEPDVTDTPPVSLDGALVTITNVASSRRLFARPDSDLTSAFGANPATEVLGPEGEWKLTRQADGSYRIVNPASDRSLYADSTMMWNDGVGAGLTVALDGDWSLVDQGGSRYRLVGQHNSRTLYAQVGKTGIDGVGAGVNNFIGDDGIWAIAPVAI